MRYRRTPAAMMMLHDRRSRARGSAQSRLLAVDPGVWACLTTFRMVTAAKLNRGEPAMGSDAADAPAADAGGVVKRAARGSNIWTCPCSSTRPNDRFPLNFVRLHHQRVHSMCPRLVQYSEVLGSFTPPLPLLLARPDPLRHPRERAPPTRRPRRPRTLRASQAASTRPTRSSTIRNTWPRRRCAAGSSRSSSAWAGLAPPGR